MSGVGSLPVATRSPPLTPRFAARTFISHEHTKTFDFCQNPELKRLHGALSLDYPGRTPSQLRPILVLSKFANNNELLMTPIEAYKNLSDFRPEDNPPWEAKSYNKLFWRGSSTGGFNHQRPWEDSHRLRLHLDINGERGNEAALRSETREVMMPDGKGGFKIKRIDRETLKEAYADVGLAGKAHQVSGDTFYPGEARPDGETGPVREHQPVRGDRGQDRVYGPGSAQGGRQVQVWVWPAVNWCIVVLTRPILLRRCSRWCVVSNASRRRSSD